MIQLFTNSKIVPYYSCNSSINMRDIFPLNSISPENSKCCKNTFGSGCALPEVRVPFGISKDTSKYTKKYYFSCNFHNFENFHNSDKSQSAPANYETPNIRIMSCSLDHYTGHSKDSQRIALLFLSSQ